MKTPINKIAVQYKAGVAYQGGKGYVLSMTQGTYAIDGQTYIADAVLNNSDTPYLILMNVSQDLLTKIKSGVRVSMDCYGLKYLVNYVNDHDRMYSWTAIVK